MVSSHCTRTERESNKECGIQTEAALLQLQVVLHSTGVSQGHTPPVPCLLQVGWVPGTFIHTKVWAKKHSTLRKLCKKYFPWVKVICSTLNHAVSHFYILLKKKVAPYLRLLLFTIHRLLRLVMEIFNALSVKERWERLTHSTRNFRREQCVLWRASFKAPDRREPGAILNRHHLPRIPSELETPEHNLLSLKKKKFKDTEVQEPIVAKKQALAQLPQWWVSKNGKASACKSFCPVLWSSR